MTPQQAWGLVDDALTKLTGLPDELVGNARTELEAVLAKLTQA